MFWGNHQEEIQNMPEEYKTRRSILFICVIIFIICIWKWRISGKALAVYVILLLLCEAAWEDARTKRIPNGIVLGIAAAGIFSIPFFPEITLTDRGIGIFCVSVPLLVITLAVPGSFGGGDIKLMAASGIYLGWEANLRAFALAVFAAGGFCIWKLLGKQLNRRERIAFGPFLCAGIIVEMLISS